jgi:hypothetical protein
MAVGEIGHGGDQLVQAWQQHPVPALLQHQGIGEVVDVFRGAGEVNEFGAAGDFPVAAGFFLQKIFDRLDVVIGRRLDLLDTPGIGLGKVRNDTVQQFLGGGREGRHFLYLFVIAQRHQPADFHEHAVTDQAVLAEERPEFSGFVLVAAVERRQGGQWIQRQCIRLVRFVHARLRWLKVRVGGRILPEQPGKYRVNAALSAPQRPARRVWRLR